MHQALATDAVEAAGAQWGSVGMRHRSMRPDWFSDVDRAWAAPVVAGSGGPHRNPDVDVVTAAFQDLRGDQPPPPLRRGDLGGRGEVLPLNSSDVRMTWDEVGAEVFAWDPASGAALWLRGAPPSGYDRVSPMRWLVHWAVAAAGGVLVHAASVAPPPSAEAATQAPRGMLLLGEAGYGKSTTALACVNRGWSTCGDDAVAVFPDPAGWHARPIYAAVKSKLDVGGVQSPLDIAPPGDAAPETVTWEIDGVKRVHLLTSTDGNAIAERIHLDALAVLEPTAPADAPVRRLPPAQARNLAAPSTTIPMPFERLNTLRRLGRLTGEVPAYSLPRRVSMERTVADLQRIGQEARLSPQAS